MQMTEMLADWNISKTLCLIAAAGAANVLQAKTVAWYRFEENGPGVVATSETRFTNSVDAAKFPAYAGVSPWQNNGNYSKSRITYEADKMPYTTNAFPSAVALVNRQDSTRQVANNGAIAININKVEDKTAPFAHVFIDDAEELRLQTFTLEFFARIPDTTLGSRCIVARCGSKYDDQHTTFNLYGNVLANGSMYMSCKFATTDDDGETSAFSTINMSGTSNLDNDRWHHFALVSDESSKTFKVYIDHNLAGSTSYTGELFYEAGYPIAFGGQPQGTRSGFCSAYLLDEVRISDEALEPSQMLSHDAAVDVACSSAVDDNTLFYFPFEGSSEPVTVGESDMQIPATYVPCYRNMAVNPSFSATDAAVFEKTSATNPAVPVRDGDVPAEKVRLGLRGRTALADAAALHSLTNSADTDYMSPLIVDTGSMQTDLFNDSCTVEFFFKLPASGYCVSSSGKIKLIGLVNAFYIEVWQTAGTWLNGLVCARIGDTDLNSDRTDHPTYSRARYNDGIWHRCALVYDKDDSRAELYIDGKVVLSKADVPIPSLARSASYSNGLLIGGDWYTDRWAGDMHIDEVRISRGALRPHQFLTATAFEEDVLAKASFENDLVMTPYTNFFGEAGSASAFTSGGSVPGYSDDVPARTLKKGKGGDVVVERNSRSLEFQGGKVVWPGRALVADADEFTVEFFMKSSSAVPGAGIMRVNRGSEADVTSEVTWAISFADASGNLRMKVDTDEATGQTHDFAAAFADDAWHHVGIQFAAVGADTLVSVYKDTSLVGTWSATGRLLTNPREMNFMLGAGEDQSAGFAGCIDELRIAPGIVDPSSFMTPVSNGMAIIFR